MDDVYGDGEYVANAHEGQRWKCEDIEQTSCISLILDWDLLQYRCEGKIEYVMEEACKLAAGTGNQEYEAASNNPQSPEDLKEVSGS